jgi:hypothetical protein
MIFSRIFSICFFGKNLIFSQFFFVGKNMIFFFPKIRFFFFQKFDFFPKNRVFSQIIGKIEIFLSSKPQCLPLRITPKITVGSFHINLTAKNSVLTPTMPDWSYLIFLILFGLLQKRLLRAKKIQAAYFFCYEFFKILCFC